jgi:hypothetical protein
MRVAVVYILGALGGMFVALTPLVAGYLPVSPLHVPAALIPSVTGLAVSASAVVGGLGHWRARLAARPTDS